MFTANFISIFIIISLALGLWGIFRSIRKIRDAYNAEKKLMNLIRKNPDAKKKIREAYEEAVKSRNYDKFLEVEKTIKEEAKQLHNLNEERRIFDAIDNNTEEGKKRYITNIIAGTINPY